MEERIQNVPAKLAQCAEIWGYVFKKERHKTEKDALNPLIGGAYAFVGIEAR